MNIFRSLIGRVWHDPDAAEVVKISDGQLFLTRSETIRGGRECIFNNAMATIRRVPTMEHHFQLVITRIYENGEEELIEDEEETDEERVFLIAEELEFRTGATEGQPTFIWRDLDGGADEFYEFIAHGTNEPTCAFFETCMYRAMYERKYKRSADNTSDADLQEFIWQPPAPKSKGKSKGKATARGTTPPEEVPGSSQQQTAPASPSPRQRAESDPSRPSIIKKPAELHLWNNERGGFDFQGNVTAKIVHNLNAGFEYWLQADNEDGPELAHKITSEMNQRWSLPSSSLTWNHTSDSGSQMSWCVAFETKNDFEEFRQFFTQSLWEYLHKESFEKAKESDRHYVLSQNYEEVEMRDAEDEEEEDEEAVQEELDADEGESEEDEPGDGVPALPGDDRNSQLTVGYKGDRSYVIRGDKIGVFSHSADGEPVKYHATITNLATPKGKTFKPSRVMLHDQDTKMVIQNPSEPNSLFSMDIERGKIVEEWRVSDYINVDHVAPDSKFAQTTPQQTVVGASHNALFRIDPRLSGNKMVDSQYKQYTGKNAFSGVATTASGKLAVASEKGDIRLFDSIGKNAKTALPPLGDPIIGIDVTADGRWIVATTKTYLLLIDTLIGEGKYTGSLGFDRSFPADAKPIPRRLQLRAEHVAYMDHSVSFSPARFNMGEGQEENAIVTSTGQFVVAWDFKKVKKGQLDKYEIKKYDDFVVQDNFKFGDDKEIIVALQNNVLAVNKKALKRPTRTSLAPPSSRVRSRSSIVNSPF